jgi:hypothetical protein
MDLAGRTYILCFERLLAQLCLSILKCESYSGFAWFSGCRIDLAETMKTAYFFVAMVLWLPQVLKFLGHYPSIHPNRRPDGLEKVMRLPNM